MYVKVKVCKKLKVRVIVCKNREVKSKVCKKCSVTFHPAELVESALWVK